MSKYYKAEDVINKVAEYISVDYSREERAREDAELLFADLPTIEVEDAISKAYLEQEIENQIMIVNDEHWRGWNNALDKVVELIENAPSVLPQVPNEDCISRHYMLRALNGYGKDWQEDCEIADIIRNAPSVIPTAKEGECPYFIDGVWCNLVGKEMKGTEK